VRGEGLLRIAGRLRRRLTSRDAELREFLEADRAGAPAAPEFRERLRRRLWTRLERDRRSEPRKGD
jgi:hypothetical protein